MDDTARARACLAEVRERSECPLGPSAMTLPITNDATRALMASAADVPCLVAAVEAALKTADRWDSRSNGYDALGQCAAELRAAVTGELLGEGDGS